MGAGVPESAAIDPAPIRLIEAGGPVPDPEVDRALTGLRPPYSSGLPIILMSAPFALSTDAPNNQSMRDLPDDRRAIDVARADRDFHRLYRELAEEALVYLLPSTPLLQDQLYTANLLVVPPHLPDTAVIANLASPPRRGESMPGRAFLSELGYDIVQSPKYFEGEADLKHLRDNVYVGGYGSRTTMSALRWFAARTDAYVVPFELTNPYLYHLDCVVMPVSSQACVVCVDACPPETVDTIAKFVDVLPVDLDLALAGVTNSVVVGRKIICGTPRASLPAQDERRAVEDRKVAFLESVCDATGRELVELPVGEFTKSGAALSCLVAHLSRG